MTEQDLQDLIVQANEELIGRRNASRATEYFTPKYVIHLSDREVAGTGPEFVQDFLRQLLNAFTDLEVEVEILVASGDRIAWVRTMAGTHKSDFMGLPGSGQRVTWREMLVSRIDEGKIAEEWHVSDLVANIVRKAKRES